MIVFLVSGLSIVISPNTKVYGNFLYIYMNVIIRQLLRFQYRKSLVVWLLCLKQTFTSNGCQTTLNNSGSSHCSKLIYAKGCVKTFPPKAMAKLMQEYQSIFKDTPSMQLSTTLTVIKLLATFNSHWHLQEKKNDFMKTFSIAEWKKPTPVQQAGHTIKQCHTCQTQYQLLTSAFPHKQTSEKETTITFTSDDLTSPASIGQAVISQLDPIAHQHTGQSAEQVFSTTYDLWGVSLVCTVGVSLVCTGGVSLVYTGEVSCVYRGVSVVCTGGVSVVYTGEVSRVYRGVSLVCTGGVSLVYTGEVSCVYRGVSIVRTGECLLCTQEKCLVCTGECLLCAKGECFLCVQGSVSCAHRGMSHVRTGGVSLVYTGEVSRVYRGVSLVRTGGVSLVRKGGVSLVRKGGVFLVLTEGVFLVCTEGVSRAHRRSVSCAYRGSVSSVQRGSVSCVQRGSVSCVQRGSVSCEYRGSVSCAHRGSSDTKLPTFVMSHTHTGAA